ncbi:MULTISPECIES: hypothetical protein [Lysinibacillus]|uniref:RNA dependent RNA polymerase n=1 Tax=Lysinibacillus TaxID=400634 RepID=UPI00214B046A|nr:MULTISPECIES: hypothetical protein [Lysinibacillus]UUV25874.1 hypothetical protein NP781_04460 [Lysinibacillus sp. FN11]UYB48747.1 hypothetical protein OCI51_07250 [Lysinibacillus capsici]
MVSALEKQVYIYSIGTESFYTDKEHEIHKKLVRLYILRGKLDKAIKKKKDNRKTRKERLIKTKKNINKIIHNYKKELTSLLNDFKGIRDLRIDSLTDNRIIGMFDSALTRTVGMKVDSLSTDLFIVRAFYFSVLNNIMKDGFTYNGEKYIYFSSSAGQIRTKKVVFIKESLWDKYEGSLTCGLSIDEINSKGGCNVNKLLAYKALTASASIKWNGFDIDKTIVVPDLETKVNSIFDYIDRDTYEITRKAMDVPIEHTDGCGMILPRKSKKAFMTRLPYVKGLLVPFPFDEFAKLHGNTKVKDIYGKEWDVIEDDIQVIFTKSQFKMKAYYDDWDDYKRRFKDNNCQAVKLNEEDIGENATLNYQMLQTLTDVSNQELKEISQATSEDILKIGNDKETMLRILGATETNKKKNHFQIALTLYPELLNDEHSKKVIKDKKKSMVNDARAGKLRINGRYLYLIPDLYAFCQRLFLGKVKPTGLLSNGDVFCNVYAEGKVDILRSPHLYKEHCVRNVIKEDKMNKWFITNGIYTSIHDPISKILQFDNDGDKALVIQDELFVSIAERNMKDIYPLYYEMGSAEPEIIDNTRIYDSLLLAFKANIGEVSNNITKIFNSEKEIDLDVVKWLTAENNYIIDYAKTLYMPKRPEEVEEKIKESIKGKVPYFFIEAKNKDKDNVSDITQSTVNRLRKIIPNRNIKFEAIAGEFDYKMLMSNNIIYINRKIIETYRKLDRSKKFLIRDTNIKDRNEGLLYVNKYIINELSKIESNKDKIVNVLVKELYGNSKSSNKSTLWDCYGDILVSNIRQNLKGTKQCESCGIRIEAVNNRVKFCAECATNINREKTRERMRKSRGNV